MPHSDRLGTSPSRPPTRRTGRDLLRGPAIVVLLAFAVGLAAGSALPGLAPVIAPFGALWVRALGALVVPLVVALLVTGVTSLAGTRAVGRLGMQAVAVFLALLAGGSTLVALVTPTLLTLLGVTHATATLAGASPPRLAVDATFPGAWAWIATLVPANPIASAASGALLPVVLFTLVFAVAVGQIADDRRGPVVGFFNGAADALLVVVRWLLWLAPAGVFALAYGLGARTGLGSARIFGAFIVLVAAVCLAFLIALYALAALTGRVPLRRFARAIQRAQVVAFASRSSLAALPAMIEASETELALPPAISGFLLPLAVAAFKLGATIAILTSSLFLARLYGVPVSGARTVSIAASAVLLSFSVPGVPAGVLLVMVPIVTGLGVPAEGVGLLLAIDVIPDMIRTLTNVTADMTAAVIVARYVRPEHSAPTGHADELR